VGLKLLQSTFNAETLLAACLGLFLSQPEIEKKSLKPPILGFNVIRVIDIDTHKKLVVSACYNEQHVCTYLQPFPR